MAFGYCGFRGYGSGARCCGGSGELSCVHRFSDRTFLNQKHIWWCCIRQGCWGRQILQQRNRMGRKWSHNFSQVYGLLWWRYSRLCHSGNIHRCNDQTERHIYGWYFWLWLGTWRCIELQSSVCIDRLAFWQECRWISCQVFKRKDNCWRQNNRWVRRSFYRYWIWYDVRLYKDSVRKYLEQRS